MTASARAVTRCTTPTKSASGNLVHTFAASPRHNSTSNLQRRKDYPGAGNDGGLADEKVEGYDGDFPDHMEKASDIDLFANQGTFCYNIEDADDHNNYGPAGYLTLQQDEPYYDLHQEDDWINRCNNSH
ncbi:hypothetical protein N7512_008692 [Penicillium capsulatum]|nr:hypothetical protein N7512_008692 [Penicillium capsulatum]